MLGKFPSGQTLGDHNLPMLQEFQLVGGFSQYARQIGSSFPKNREPEKY